MKYLKQYEGFRNSFEAFEYEDDRIFFSIHFIIPDEGNYT